MNTVNGTNSNTYLNLVQQATKRNTLTHVTDAKQSGQTVDVEQLQSSNQSLRDSARETGVTLYSQQLQKQAFDYLAETPQKIPKAFHPEENLYQRICDYLAGMTDDYLREFVKNIA